MTTLQLIGIIAILAVAVIGIGLKIYTRRTLNDMDGIDETVVGEADEVYNSINRKQL